MIISRTLPLPRQHLRFIIIDVKFAEKCLLRVPFATDHDEEEREVPCRYHRNVYKIFKLNETMYPLSFRIQDSHLYRLISVLGKSIIIPLGMSSQSLSSFQVLSRFNCHSFGSNSVLLPFIIINVFYP